MKLLNLKLRGSIGVFKGLGLNEIEIDFTQFGPGLIALTGKNGSGKTSILENCHAYRCMISRDGSLQSHFFLKDSHRILKFEQDGKIYEAKILVDALTGSSEAYLLCDNKPLNDGKLTTFDVEIEKVLGSQELFFNSVFSSQKSKGISELKPADRRKLFYELLNLNSYEVYLEESKLKLKLCENDLAKIEGEIKALQQDQTSVDILEIERQEKLNYQAQLIEEISELETKIDALTSTLQQSEVKLQLAREKAENNTKLRQEISTLEQQLKEIKSAHDTKLSRYNSEIEDQNKLIERYKKLADPESKIKVEQALSDKKDFTAKLDELRKVASNLEKGYSDFQKEYSNMLKDLGSTDNHLSDARLKEKSVLNNLENINRQIKECEDSVQLISKVPCDEETGKSCQFLVNAYESGKKLDQLIENKLVTELELQSRMDDVKSLKAEYNHKKEMVESFYNDKDNYFRGSIKTNNDAIKLIEQSLASLNQHNYEKLLEEIKDASNKIHLCELSIEGAHNLIIEAENSFEGSLKQINSRIKDLNNRYDETILIKIEELNAEVNFAKQNLTGLKQELQSSQARVDEAKQDVARLEQVIETMTKNEERITKLVESKSKVESEIKDWNFLIKAFGKEGIPVLKLENSGIEITSVANELLSIFENKFRIVFETTSLTKDKKKTKETFDINIVSDNDKVELSNLSGGQKVWVETALRLAISLLVRAQGKNIKTSFLDEADGQLDSDNAHLYLEMLRKAHDKSDVHNTFLITHRLELLDLIPQQISLHDGYLEIIN